MILRDAKVFLDKVNLCGCGTSNWEYILWLLEKGADHDKNGSYYDMEGTEQRSIEFGAKVLDSWGFLEHGTGIGWAWLTDEGEGLLKWLRDQGCDDSLWPEGWDHGKECPCGCEDVVVSGAAAKKS